VLGLSQWLMDAEDIHIGSARYLLQLRAKRYYKPYAITLLKFTHDRYTGTDRPKNFSSLIRLIDPSHGEDREVNIWMNHPLRYPSWRDPAGETIYQLSAGAEDRGTVLQVVRNPAWWIPYLACLVGSAGMLIHFLPRLSRYMAKPAPRAAWDRPSVLTAAAGVILCGGCFIAWLVPPSVKGVDTAEFGKIPICYEGRVQPLDSAARNSLKLLSGHDTIKGRDGRRRPAIAWLLDLFAGREAAEDYKVFRIDYPDLVDMLGPDSSQKLFSWRELRDSSAKLEPQLRRLEKTDPARFDQFQMALAELRGKIGLFAALNRFGGLYLAPPATPGAEWRPLEPMGPGSAAGQGIEYLRLFNSMLDACVEGQPAEFNRLLADYRGQVRRQAPADSQAVEFEAFFNRADPFFFCQLLYVLIFVMVVVSWLAWTKPLGRAALTVLILTLILHTLGLAGEISISGRPPVTDLTSSAIFIAWGIGLVCLILERIFRNGIGIVIAAILGFCSLHIAYRLSLRGEDAFQVLMAVLDTNFWLATHVLCISFGYAASFLAGFMGIAYLVMGLGTKRLAGARGKPLADMIYGTVVFAAIMSFVGTVLGGIWADQSWGRFWGWDPKENGALLVVLTNVLLLHARWGGLVRNRGMALLAIFGNIVTAWSWFGTNMYGVGLHSYGHMESGQPWLIGFVLSQFLLILLGWFLPSCAWTSLRDLESI